MITYTTALATLQTLTGVPSTDTTTSATLIKFWNDARRTVSAIRGGSWPWLELEKTVLTTADQNYMYIPNDMRKITAVRVVIGSGTSATVYLPVELCDIQRWQLVLAYRLGSNQYPYFAYQQGQKLLFAPTPSVDDTSVIMTGRRNIRDVNIADYTTGTITSVPYTTTFTGAVASGATSATLSGAWGLTTGSYLVKFSNSETRLVTLTASATTATWTNALTSAATSAITVSHEGGGSIVTASGTTFTADMVGRYMRITETTAAGGGDGYWYEIGTYYSATIVALTKPYEGTALAAASAAYTVGQITYEPEAYQMAPIYRAVAQYWDYKENMVLSERYWRLYDGGQEIGKSELVGGLIGQMLEEASGTWEGSYIAPSGNILANLQQAPYYFPTQDASGLT